MLHRGRRSRALCSTDEDLKLLGKTVARLDFGSDDEQATDADARQAEAVAGAACGGGSVHDVSSGLVHADRGAASGVGGEHSVPVRYDEVSSMRGMGNQQAWSMEKEASAETRERGERAERKTRERMQRAPRKGATAPSKAPSRRRSRDEGRRAHCTKGSGKTQPGDADRAEHAWLEKTALPLGV